MEASPKSNLSINDHIDHGNTTLSDRLLHRPGTIATRDMSDQLLDAMDLERERGITIEAHPVTMLYKARNGETYELNLIDTPGHVDFAYEVSRSLSARARGVAGHRRGARGRGPDGGELSSGGEAETVDHPGLHQDSPGARKHSRRRNSNWRKCWQFPSEWAIPCSAKEGIGIEDILEAIVERVTPPKTRRARSVYRRWRSIHFLTPTREW